MPTIVLAHGVLGFGNFPLSLVTYFNGIAKFLQDQHYVVVERQVAPIGTIEKRGADLAHEILTYAPPVDPISIIAHSMGGLDARYALAHVPALAQRVRTLITIGTPHRGSPVADAIERAAAPGADAAAHAADPLLAHVPFSFRKELLANTGALHCLTTGYAATFNPPDAPNVKYFEIAGDAALGGHELLFYELAQDVLRVTHQVNDGVVTKDSALRAGHNHLQDWPVDHPGEIGWTLDTLVPVPWDAQPRAAHFDRYEKLIPLL